MATASTLYTIGHGNKETGRFLEELRSFGIEYLADIRTKPYSKWNPCYNQETLRATIEAAGIRYVYMGDAIGGLPDDATCYTDGHIDYGKLREKDYFVKGLQRLVNANSKGVRLALMCSESDPSMCHRSKLVGEELMRAGIEISHIVGKGKALSQRQVMATLTEGYGTKDLFGNERTFMSRKKYK